MTGEFGPPFQQYGSRLYRAEYVAATVGIIAYLAWRALNGGGIDWLAVVFWALFPDLAAFIPIAASSQRRSWPSWGPTLYNFFHNALVWAAVFVVLFAAGGPYWPLLGWLGHITADRAMGFGLRAGVATSDKR